MRGNYQHTFVKADHCELCRPSSFVQKNSFSFDAVVFSDILSWNHYTIWKQCSPTRLSLINSLTGLILSSDVVICWAFARAVLVSNWPTIRSGTLTDEKPKWSWSKWKSWWSESARKRRTSSLFSSWDFLGLISTKGYYSCFWSLYVKFALTRWKLENIHYPGSGKVCNRTILPKRFSDKLSFLNKSIATALFQEGRFSLPSHSSPFKNHVIGPSTKMRHRKKFAICWRNTLYCCCWKAYIC